MESSAPSLLPFVSVILPIRNERESIKTTLHALLTQNYPADRMEILIVDGMSTDGTCKEIYSIIARSQYKKRFIIIFANTEKIVSTGLNIALRRARGEIMVRVDGHTVVASDYVSQCVDVLQRSGADNVGGRMDAEGRTVFGEAVALATSTPFGVGGARFHYSTAEEWVDTVYMGAWPRRVFEKIGLFDEELIRDQDDEFNYRLREQGGRILLSPVIRSKYTVRSTPGALWRQYYQYGYWKIRVLQKHPRQMNLRQFVPPAFVLSLLVGFFLLFIPLPLWRFYPLCVIFFLYLIANLMASSLTMRKCTARSPRAIFYILPFVFAILHIGYGLGFLVGLFKFVHRWGDKRGRVPPFVSHNA